MCVIMKNFVKIGQTIVEISQFLKFQDDGRPPSWIFKISNLNSQPGSRPMYHRASAIPNFIKIGQMVVEIWHILGLTVFKITVLGHLDFQNLNF